MKANSKLSLKKETLVKLNDSQMKSVKGGKAYTENGCTTRGTYTSRAVKCCVPPCL